MMYSGNSLQVRDLSEGIAELIFVSHDNGANLLNQETIRELEAALDCLDRREGLQGLLVSSAAPHFILGADVTEFGAVFSETSEQIASYFAPVRRLFDRLENLPCPSVALINGQALGGGFELSLALDYRILATDAQVGLPEVTLGLIPGWGGTIRLPRLIGAENALGWITSGQIQSASAGIKFNAADAVVAPAQLRAAGLKLLAQCKNAKLDYISRRKLKQNPVPMDEEETDMFVSNALPAVYASAGPHYPAPVEAVNLIQQTLSLTAHEAAARETSCFVRLAKTDVCASLVNLFLHGQSLKRRAKQAAKSAPKVKRAAIIGAGIMGGGIAYQSSYSGVPAVMRDIHAEALRTGMAEAIKLLGKQVERGKISSSRMTEVLTAISPTLHIDDIAGADIVVEAVVENPKVKLKVLAEVEQQVAPDAFITSNTSTISIDHLAEALRDPQRFCGMHFFNPVPMMPLVEIIRGSQTGDTTINAVVAYANAIGKTPVVVKDCPGFLINRILFPYLLAFDTLVCEGADFRTIDKTMESFGWPMGPAYLMDVVGLDTCHHCINVLAAGYPERMQNTQPGIIDALYRSGHYGQKTGKGFYRYEQDAKGKPKKLYNPDIDAQIAQLGSGEQRFNEQEIIDRMMIPMCMETIRCLEEGIVSCAADADIAQVMGIGFPKFRGGALRYVDSLGSGAFLQLAEQYKHCGPLYEPTPGLREMARRDEKFYS